MASSLGRLMGQVNPRLMRTFAAARKIWPSRLPVRRAGHDPVPKDRQRHRELLNQHMAWAIDFASHLDTVAKHHAKCSAAEVQIWGYIWGY